MFVRISLLFLIFTAALPLLPAAEVTPEDIRAALPDRLEHPYVLFSKTDKAEILERIASDRESSDIFRRLEAECGRLLYTPVDKAAPPQDPRAGYTRNDERLAYLRTNISNALKLAFVYQMTGEKRYAEKSFEFADAACDLPTWVDRRHQFPVIYSRVWPWNVNDDQASFGVDLETTDSARNLALVYDWLYQVLEKRQRDRIRGAILEKAILPVRGNYDYHWWASAYRCNWAACCNSGLGTASLALLTEDPGLTDVVAESLNRIWRTFDEIGVNGGWQEGCGYYRKGIHAANFFADPLNRLTGRKFDLYTHPRLRANPITFLLYNTVTPRRLLPFEDSTYNRAGTSHIWNKLAEETKSPETAWFREYMWDEGRDMFDIIWPRSSVKPALPETASMYFRSIDWAVLRNGFADPGNFVVACKAGMNDDPHHGHLDIGHFIVYWRNQEYICDASSPEYDELYFDEKRWDYVDASSLGHNVVMVNGEQQVPAKLKDMPWKEGVGGEILEFRPGKERDYVLMDPSDAYPGKELKGWRRHIVFEKTGAAVILDEIETEPGAEIEIRFHSQCRVTPKDGSYVMLSGDEGTMALVVLSEEDFSIETGKDASLMVLENARFTWIPWFAAKAVAGNSRTVAATIIMPVENASEADALAASATLRSGDGDLILQGDAGNRTISCSFEKTAEGLVLKK